MSDLHALQRWMRAGRCGGHRRPFHQFIRVFLTLPRAGDFLPSAPSLPFDFNIIRRQQPQPGTSTDSVAVASLDRSPSLFFKVAHLASLFPTLILVLVIVLIINFKCGNTAPESPPQGSLRNVKPSRSGLLFYVLHSLPTRRRSGESLECGGRREREREREEHSPTHVRLIKALRAFSLDFILL